MREKDKRQFFAKRPNTTTVKVNGKFGFNSLPTHMQEEIKKRLAAKDDVMARGMAGEIPGLKIDGKQVTRDNIKDFEIGKKESKKEPKEEVKEKEESNEYVKEDLEKLSFSKLKKLAKKLGETGRSSTGLIKDILKHNGK